MSVSLRQMRPVYVTGIGLHPYQRRSEQPHVELGLTAVREALADEISEGIPFSSNIDATGTISILADYVLQETVKAFADKAGDNRILNAVLYLQNKRAPREVILITKTTSFFRSDWVVPEKNRTDIAA